jgi:hypothetical protein
MEAFWNMSGRAPRLLSWRVDARATDFGALALITRASMMTRRVKNHQLEISPYDLPSIASRPTPSHP